jgi:ATP-binding cassette subfamily F protein 3
MEQWDCFEFVGTKVVGKSTLLKLLVGEIVLTAGLREDGHNARNGCFSQHRAATLYPKNSMLEDAIESARRKALEPPEAEARGILASYLFLKEEVLKKTSVQSEGEKTWFNLIKFPVDPPQVLLMDDLTNHLDKLTNESLTLALETFAGRLVLIPHDIHFIRKLADRFLHVKAGRVTLHPCGNDYFLEKSTGLLDEPAAVTAA